MNTGNLVLGLVNGMIIGLLAVGLVLIYRANRFLNLAHASFGVLSTTLMDKFLVQWNFNWWLAFAICVPLGSVLAVLSYRLIIRPLQNKTRSSVVSLLASIGIAEFLGTFAYVKQLAPPVALVAARGGFPLPFASHITIGGVTLFGDSIAILIIAPIVVAALSFYLRYTTAGKMTRAASANEDEARLVGIWVRRVSGYTWAIAGGLSALTAILYARQAGVGMSTGSSSSSFGSDLLFIALGAAALGGFRSISLALAGGLGLGVAQQLTLGVSGSGSEATLVVFVLIMLIVLSQGRRIAGAFDSSTTVLEDLRPLRIPPLVRDHALVRMRRLLLIVPFTFIAVLAPKLPGLRTGANQFLLTMILVSAILAISLTILIGWAGQISLGHVAVLAAGAYTAARLVPHGISLPIILALSGVVGAVVLVIVGLPALRIRGLTLAVTTLGLAVLGPEWLFQQSFFGSGKPYGILLDYSPAYAPGLGRPSSMLAIYYVTLVVLGLVLGATYGLRRSRPGRLLIAVRDNERGAEAFGISPVTSKLAMLAVSGLIAGVAGAMYALAWQEVTTSQFTPDLSLAAMAVPVIGGLGSLTGAVAGALFLYVPAYFLTPELSSLFGKVTGGTPIQLLLTGITLPLVLLAYPTGIVGAAQRGIEGLLTRMAAVRARMSGAAAADVLPLQVEGVTLSFGGVLALDGASLTVPEGKIIGLIGPNGAGKTTLINAISGVLRPRAGSIKVYGREVLGLPASYRAAFGIGRSFQEARLFPGLTVTEAIQVALNRRHRVGIASAMSWTPWARAAERRSRSQAQELAARFGLAEWKDTLTVDLSTGTRRLCDLVAQVATGARILLLDEPTAGVSQREAEAFAPVLRQIREELDCTVLIIEHDMPLLMSVSDHVYAMESGRVIAEGSPDEIRANPLVIASYLGTDEVAIARSGQMAKSSDVPTGGATTAVMESAARTAVKQRPPAKRTAAKRAPARRAPTREAPAPSPDGDGGNGREGDAE